MPNTPPPLDDPTLVAYLDAFAAGPDFRAGSVMLLLADEQAQVLLGVAIDEDGSVPARHERTRLVGGFLRMLGEADLPVAGFALLVCRDGFPDACGDDLAWHDAARQGCLGAGWRWYGAYLVTGRGAAAIVPAAA